MAEGNPNVVLCERGIRTFETSMRNTLDISAARVFDEKEMCALTDATLDFWLTTGRFADQFEKEVAKWIGVKFAHLVNSGSSANLIAFMALGFQSDVLSQQRFQCFV